MRARIAPAEDVVVVKIIDGLDGLFKMLPGLGLAKFAIGKVSHADQKNGRNIDNFATNWPR